MYRPLYKKYYFCINSILVGNDEISLSRNITMSLLWVQYGFGDGAESGRSSDAGKA